MQEYKKLIIFSYVMGRKIFQKIPKKTQNYYGEQNLASSLKPILAL